MATVRVTAHTKELRLHRIAQFFGQDSSNVPGQGGDDWNSPLGYSIQHVRLLGHDHNKQIQWALTVIRMWRYNIEHGIRKPNYPSEAFFYRQRGRIAGGPTTEQRREQMRARNRLRALRTCGRLAGKARPVGVDGNAAPRPPRHRHAFRRKPAPHLRGRGREVVNAERVAHERTHPRLRTRERNAVRESR